MKKVIDGITLGLAIILVAFLGTYGWRMANELSYEYQYEEQVRRTVCDMVVHTKEAC